MSKFAYYRILQLFFENISYCFLFRTRSVPWGEDTLFTFNFSTFSKLFHPVFWSFIIFFRKYFILFSFQDEIHVEENVPWGEDTLFTLEFREEANKYSIHTCNNMYLQRDGKLVPAVNKVGSKLTPTFLNLLYQRILLGFRVKEKLLNVPSRNSNYYLNGSLTTYLTSILSYINREIVGQGSQANVADFT